MKILSFNKKGFTLIEILISTAIFSVVMVIALGALLAMSASDRKAEAVKSVVNNMNFALDSMSRSIRTGTAYDCSATSLGAPTNCASGGSTLFFTTSGGTPLAYRLENASTDAAAATVCNQPSGGVGCIARSTQGGAAGSWLAITSPDAVITNANLFYVRGALTGSGDNTQPIVTISLAGYIVVNGGASALSNCLTGGVSNGQCSLFQVQSSVTQRVYDQ